MATLPTCDPLDNPCALMCQMEPNYYLRTKAPSVSNNYQLLLTHATYHQASNTPCYPSDNCVPTKLVCASLICHDPKQGREYSALTGQFPTQSTKGMNCTMVFYYCDHNYTRAIPLKNRSDAECLWAHQQFYDECLQCGAPPALNNMDNEASHAIKAAMLAANIDYQLKPPDNHRVNAAKCAIRTFKNHFIAGLATADPNFPIQLWDRLLDQCEITLNLPRTSRLNTRLSAFNRAPLALPGTRALVFEDPKTRRTWAPHGKEGCYLGPALQHYRCYNFCMPSTRGARITNTAQFPPTAVNMPAINSTTAAIQAATDLTRALTNPSPTSPFQIKDPTLTALRQLASLFNKTTKHLPRVQTDTTVTPTPASAASLRVTCNSTIGNVPRPPNTPTQHQCLTRTSTRLHNNGNVGKVPSIPNLPTQHWHLTRTRTRVHNHGMFSAATIDQLMDHVLVNPWPHEECTFVVNDEDTGLGQNYKQLIANAKTRILWSRAMCKELGCLVQGHKDLTHNTNTMKTHALLVVDYRPQKEDPDLVRITIRSNLINYPGQLMTVCHGPLTPNFYLETPMERCEHMRNPRSLIPDEFMDAHDLHSKVHKDHIYLEIRPQAGKIDDDPRMS